MLIKKPAYEVFQAFIDPDVTTKFWFTDSTGKLTKDGVVIWSWSMYNISFEVRVLELIPNQEIVIQWGDDPSAKVYWKFENLTPSSTFVTIKNIGFKGSTDEIIAQVNDATGGFTWVLAGLKAYLEHGILLNLIADRHPKLPLS